MKQKQLDDLTDEELMKKWKEIQSHYQITLATLIVSLLLTVIRAIVSGLSFSLLYLPVFIVIITTTIWLNYKSVKENMKARNLEQHTN